MASLKQAEEYARRLYKSTGRWVHAPTFVEPGHFYSPIPSISDLRAREDQVFAVPDTIPGIELRDAEQLELVSRLAEHYVDQPFTPAERDGQRYYFDNPFFGFGDGLILHLMLRELRPRRVVEVGSGFSSAVILDTVDGFLGAGVECTFIEPHPERLWSLLRDNDASRHTIIEEPVQTVDIDVFTDLEAGDVLFVDSTHVCKTGSDVNHLFFEVFPLLPPGVLVHVHDVFYPFEYPSSWVLEEGRAWSEAYLLRALLMYSTRFEVTLWNSYLEQFHLSAVVEALPLWGRDPGGSIWLTSR